MFDSLAMFESPIQIAIVLLIALLVFGPKRLPEIGKQIGSALRELKKAGSDVMNSFNTDHEPDHNDYSSAYKYPYENETTIPYSSGYALEAPPDLTDYTISGQPPKDSYEYGYDQHSYASEHSSNGSAVDPAALDAYNIAPSSHASAATGSGDMQKEGKLNV